jgi:hypothetical protein
MSRGMVRQSSRLDFSPLEKGVFTQRELVIDAEFDEGDDRY